MKAMAAALCDGRLDLDPGADRAGATAALATLAGIGPSTASTIAMRALGDPDQFLASDLGVRQAAAALDLPQSPARLSAYAERWRPWRSYAVQYLWGTLDHPIAILPRIEVR
jgi:AraC family transcriptional regulator of adaptative response / DNA-3-methyladenine glycosylase II